MKMKFVRNVRTDRRELVVALQRDEHVDERRAKALSSAPSPLFVPFSWESQRTGALLRYDVEGLWSLRTFLAKRPLGTPELLGLLSAVEGVLDACAAQRLRSEGLFFDPEYVFVDAQCQPHFVLLVVEELAFQERNSPLALLKALGEAERLHFSSPDADSLSRRIGAFVVDAGGVFSANAFHRFLEGETTATDATAPEARRSVVEGGGTSTWASAGAVAPTPTDGAALFWNPLMGIAAEEEAPQPAPHVIPTEGAVGPGVEGSPAPRTQAPAVELATPPQPAPAPQAATAPQPATSPQPAPAPQSAPASASRVALVRVRTGEEYPLVPGTPTTLGRGSACAVRLLGNPKLSRQHASVTFDGNALQVSDLGAANGTWVGDTRLAPHQPKAARVGERIRLADEELYVRTEEA